MKKPKLTDIAAAINVHLKKMEKAQPKDGNTRELYMAGACVAGSRISIGYVSYQGRDSLTRDEALAYLAHLDGGGTDRHYAIRDALRAPERERKQALWRAAYDRENTIKAAERALAAIERTVLDQLIMSSTDFDLVAGWRHQVIEARKVLERAKIGA